MLNNGTQNTGVDMMSSRGLHGFRGWVHRCGNDGIRVEGKSVETHAMRPRSRRYCPAEKGMSDLIMAS